MKNKIISSVLIILVGVALIGSGYALGFQSGKRYPQNLIVQGVPNINGPADSNADFTTFWQAWQLINDSYLKNDKVTNQQKVEGAIKGLVGSLGDPYSVYFPAEESKKFQEDVQGNFGGIGAELGVRKDQLVIIAPLKDTPASKAGLKAGDQILGVNSSSTENVPLDEAVSWIRGTPGSKIKLVVYRSSWDKPQEFNLTRENISVPTLDLSMKGDIAYIQLYAFNSNAVPLFANAVNKVIDNKAKGIVLDLRDNPGGYLDSAVNIAGFFVPKDTLVVSEESRIAPKEDLKTTGNGELKNIPIVVLINGGSASASEILAGALRDDRGVKLIGEQSFGKGTVQQIIDLRDDASMKLTIAHWVMPSGKILEEKGISPDIEVKLTEQDVNNKKDPQLDKALEVVRSEIK